MLLPADPSALRPGLQQDECHVWWARPDDYRPVQERLLDVRERARLMRLRRREDRARFVVGAALARTMAAGFAELRPAAIGLDRTCPRCGAPHGKPRVVGAGAELELSVSHSGGRVVAALALGRPVGVDVEAALDDGVAAMELAEPVLAASELRRLGALPVDDRPGGFLRYWTRKEALVKAVGRGLDVPLASFVVTGPGQPGRVLAWPADPHAALAARLTDLRPGAGFVASVAVLGEATRVVEADAAARLASLAARA